MEEAKIQFSPSEMDLMCNASVILTKNKILYNIKALFEAIEQQLLKEAYLHYSAGLNEVFEPMPKISKGENYLGLPYIVLDYPRQFDTQNIFAIRTMFWWGHEFSSTLHLTGNYKTGKTEQITAAYKTLSKNNYYIGINEDPWQHHFEEDNYQPINELSEETFADYCRQFDHLKIAARYPLRDVHFVGEDLIESWKRLLEICR